MTLIEVMIASAVMLTLALGMATFMSNQYHDVKSVRQHASYHGMQQAVRDTASAESAVVNSISATD
jgi:Tfp pilus assembly protein PilV